MRSHHVVVDAHQHVWDPGVADYPWLTGDLTRLNRSYDQPDVEPQLRAAGVTASVLVQAADNVEDTLNMFRVAEQNAGVAGVVAWLPLHDVDACTALLAGWAGRPVVGVRHLVHRDPDPEWLLRRENQPGLALLARCGLVFDVCAESPSLLAQVPAVARAHPTLRLVIDHLAKPPVREGGWQPWADLLSAAATIPSVSVKLSGLNTATGPGWSGADFQPYVDHALATFGPQRLMYGGDWPFALLTASSYGQVHAALVQTLSGLSDEGRAEVMGRAATRIYRLRLPARPHRERA